MSTQSKVRNHDWTLNHEGADYSLPAAIKHLDDLTRSVEALEEQVFLKRDTAIVSVFAVVGSVVAFFTTNTIQEWVVMTAMFGICAGIWMLLLGGMISAILSDGFRIWRSDKLETTRCSVMTLHAKLTSQIRDYLASTYQASTSPGNIESIVTGREQDMIAVRTPEGYQFARAIHRGDALMLVEDIETHSTIREL